MSLRPQRNRFSENAGKKYIEDWLPDIRRKDLYKKRRLEMLKERVELERQKGKTWGEIFDTLVKEKFPPQDVVQAIKMAGGDILSER